MGGNVKGRNVYNNNSKLILTASQHINSSVAGSSTSVQSFVKKAGTVDKGSVFSDVLVYMTEKRLTFLNYR